MRFTMACIAPLKPVTRRMAFVGYSQQVPSIASLLSGLAAGIGCSRFVVPFVVQNSSNRFFVFYAL